jgi:stage IV sporulation protein FB
MEIPNSPGTENQLMSVFYPPKPGEPERPKKNVFVQFITSLLVFGAAWYFLINKNIELIIWIVVILIIHELGHYLAMKIFRYEDLAIFFIPLLGAAARGSKEKASQKEKAIVLLAGPIPGIVIGIILFFLTDQTAGLLPTWLPYAFVLVNMFNLLPIYPLDGGQLFRTLFMPDRDILSFIFLLLSMLLVTWYAIDHKDWILLLISFSLLVRLVQMNMLNKLRRRLDELGINFRKTYSALTDEEYWRIRDEMSANPSFGKYIVPGNYEVSEKEGGIVNFIKQVLKIDPIKDLSAGAIILILALWIAGIAVPFLLMDRIWNIL